MAAVTTAVVAGAASTAYAAKSAKDASKKSAQIQSDSAAAASELTGAAQEQLRSDLSPFRQAGEAAIPMLQEFATNPQARVDALQQNPLFQASLNSRDRDTLGAAATQGRIGTGGLSQQLSENFMISASPLLQQQEQSLLNLANMGQASAAQTGTAGLQSAQIQGNLGMQGANAQSAGILASQQASAQRNNQYASLLSGVLGGLG